jgi:hypothetical protein
LVGKVSSHQVLSLTGVWSSELRTSSKPEISVEPGYHRVVASIGSTRPLNCFVYEVPIDAGQAVTRLIRAISVGLEFERIEPRSVTLVGAVPLVHISGSYRESETGRPGFFKLAIAPRTQYPVVCTHDEIGFVGEFESSVKDFLESFEVTETSQLGASVPMVSEVWKLSDDSGSLGFSTFRFYRGPKGEKVSLEVSSTYSSVGDRLRTTDSVALENEDEAGLLSGKWLDIVDTRPLLQIMLERRPEDAQHFRFIGEVDGEQVSGQFESEIPLSSSGAAALELQKRSRGPEPFVGELSFLRYEPRRAVGAPVKQVYSETAVRGKIRVDRAGETSDLRLGADGLPDRSHASGGSRQALLLHRETLGAVVEGP